MRRTSRSNSAKSPEQMAHSFGCWEVVLDRWNRGNGMAGVWIHNIKDQDRVERNRFTAVHSNRELPILADLFDGADIAVGKPKFAIARGELKTVTAFLQNQKDP